MRVSPLIYLLITALSISSASAADLDQANESYRLGSGYTVGDSGFRLGGYANLQFNAPHKAPWVVRTHDISLFLTWDSGSRLRFFSELEGGDVFWASQQESPSTRYGHFEFERFYFDELINDNLTVRLGKFLTPVGQWNPTHASPLVWTTNRPVATENLFSTHATGAMLHGTVSVAEHQLDYAVYGDMSSELDPHRSKDPFDNAVGAYFRYAVNDNLQIGSSFQHYKLAFHQGATYDLAGFDVAWSYQKHEISSEIVYRSNEQNANDHQWQGFIQGVSPLIDHWYLIGRYEFFEQTTEKTGQVGVFGLAFRPLPPLVWKVEYRWGQHNEMLAPDGLSASFAVLF